MSTTRINLDDLPLGVAIVGMSGRFPGADDPAALWRNLCDGIESIQRFTDEELLALGVDAAALAAPGFVKAGGPYAGIKEFDAGFFGYSPAEARIMDPQHRLFLECAWEALENAGYVPEAMPGAVGVYGGCGAPSYLLCNLLPQIDVTAADTVLPILNGNDKDSFASRVAYKLNLRGPALTVQTACSTSLVAIHLACQALLTYQCDAALAGGVSLFVPQRTGYLFQPGEIASPDGHCRAFDARAAGTVFCSGAGVVVLKRLDDAVAAGDRIVAVIRGSAINNDGGHKIGFTAPSIDGQREVIAMAHAAAGVDARSIGYVEAHGTATPLGDPVEIAALAGAFRATSSDRQFCALGSLKSNVGHLDTAAGVAGVIKAALAVHHGLVPPTLHFETENPQIGFAETPFVVADRLTRWDTEPRRAGVSSFGIGGTNAHIVLEQTPVAAEAGDSRVAELLPLSARSPRALAAAAARLADHLEHDPPASLGDVAHTLQNGRRAFSHRAFVVSRTVSEAVQKLRALASAHVAAARPIVFAFPGQGSEYVGMARDLYDAEPVFRDEIDAALPRLRELTGHDFRSVVFGQQADAASVLGRTDFTQPALFVLEMALARLWMHWGITPTALIGHSVGEYAAACVAGVFTFEDALATLVERGRLVQETAPGAMLVVSLSSDALASLLPDGVSLAAINGAQQCAVSGSREAISQLEHTLDASGTVVRRMPAERAFHSALLEPVLAAFERHLAGVRLQPPTIPLVSNVTGDWMQPDDAMSPSYWSLQLRETVRFADGIEKALHDPSAILVEVGPGGALGKLARAHLPPSDRRVLAASLPSARASSIPALDHMLEAAGQLWACGAPLRWSHVRDGASNRRVPLPTYPFERQTYWIDPPAASRMPHASLAVNADEAVTSDATTTSAAQHARPATLTSAYVAARTPTETSVLAIWETLLGITGIGVNDDFFELGGDSLIAVRVAARIREELQVPLDLRAIFESKTVAAIAAAITPSGEDLADLLDEIDNLSDDEVAALLEQRRGSSSPWSEP